MSIMQEAMNAGIKTGIVNSGSIVEPGTGVFVASETSRSKDEEITKKIIESGADVILSGGEEWLLPEGEGGKFCAGKRKDGINLIEYATQHGYKVVYDREELLNIPNNIQKVLGIFAGHHTFNAVNEEEQVKDQLTHYNSNAPTLAEMTKKAIEILSQNDSQFFLVVEEEGTDNFGNHTNASGMLEALKRADDAIGVTLEYMKENSNTLLITASDSEAGGMEVFGDPVERMNPENPLSEFDETGAQIDGINGAGSLPFISAPDKYGNSFPFAIIWSTHLDTYGSVVARAHGMNAEFCNGSFDNTDVYKIMYLTLFGKAL
jgi:alkaline phosphatase